MLVVVLVVYRWSIPVLQAIVVPEKLHNAMCVLSAPQNLNHRSFPRRHSMRRVAMACRTTTVLVSM